MATVLGGYSDNTPEKRTGLKEVTVTTDGVKTFLNVDSGGQNYTVKIAYSGSNPVYIGHAARGSLASEEAWRIKKITYDGDNITDIQWAEGEDTFDKEWDERANYSYS